jgi:hypothetical protein
MKALLFVTALLLAGCKASEVAIDSITAASDDSLQVRKQDAADAHWFDPQMQADALRNVPIATAQP